VHPTHPFTVALQDAYNDHEQPLQHFPPPKAEEQQNSAASTRSGYSALVC